MAGRQEAAEESTSRGSGWNWLRNAAIWLVAIVACLSLAGYVAVRLVEHQILNTDNWVAMVAPLPKQQVVSDALGTQISNQIFNEQAVEARITDALPQQAAFLAGPLTDQLSSLTERLSRRVVASDAFQTIWEGANRAAMGRLLATARGQTPPLQARLQEKFNLNLSGASGNVGALLGKAAAAIPALQPGAKNTIAISADLQAKRQRLHQIIVTIDKLAVVLPLATIAAFLTALAISRRRRITWLWTMIGAVALLLIELIVLKWSRGYVLDQVRHPENIPAVTYIFDTLTAGLKHSFYVALTLLVILLILGWLAGPYQWAVKFRSVIALDRLRASTFGRWWVAARLKVGRWLYYSWIAIFLVVLGGLLLRSNISTLSIINALLLIAALWSATYIFARPRYRPAQA